MKSLLLVLGLTLSLAYSAHAQRACASTDYTNHLIAADPAARARMATVASQVEQTLSALKKNNTARRDTTANEVIYIPVVVHVLYKTAAENISDAQVRSQIDALNKDFNRLNDDRVNTPAAFQAVAGDARIQFCLAKRDPKGVATTGVDRQFTTRDFFTADDAMKDARSGGVNAWNSNEYLNLWVCKLNGRSIGYATPPGASPEKDGVVIAYNVFGTIEKVRAPFNKGRTATHEVGHWMGLTHIWGDDQCGDDHVDDTPAQQSYNFGCPSFPKMSTCSPNANGDMFMNFMDFSDDACMNMFTQGQAKRMRALFARGNLRNAILESKGCVPGEPAAGPLPVDTLEIPKLTITLSGARFYPNPIQSVVTIESKAISATSPVTLRLVSLTGGTVFTTTLIQEKTTIQIPALLPGTYVAELISAKEKYATRVVKM